MVSLQPHGAGRPLWDLLTVMTTMIEVLLMMIVLVWSVSFLFSYNYVILILTPQIMTVSLEV